MALTHEDIGHEVGDPDAMWDMRGVLVSLSEPGPYGSMCTIRLCGTGELYDIGARGFVRTFGTPVHKTEEEELKRIVSVKLEETIRAIDSLLREAPPTTFRIPYMEAKQKLETMHKFAKNWKRK